MDVNVLLALADSSHIHHDLCHQWFASTATQGWATCPLTENAFVRIASNPRYPNSPGDAPAVLNLLRQMCQVEGHQFLPDSVSLRSLFQSQAFTHNWLTDLYLLGLARDHAARLATLDQNIPARLLPGGQDALEVIR